MTWSPDSRYLAAGYTDGVVRLWDIHKAGESPVLSQQFHRRFVRSLSWSPDGIYIVSGGDFGDSTLQVWEALSGKPLFTYKEQYRIFSVAWSPDAQIIASGCFDGTVHLLHRAGNNISPAAIYHGHKGPVYTVAWSPDGRSIASAGEDTQVHIWQWDIPDKSERIYQGHSRAVKTLAWSPDGRYLVSAGDDTTLQVWDVATGEVVANYKDHTTWVRTVAWSPDGTYIASSSDKTIQIRLLDPSSLARP